MKTIKFALPLDEVNAIVDALDDAIVALPDSAVLEQLVEYLGWHCDTSHSAQ